MAGYILNYLNDYKASVKFQTLIRAWRIAISKIQIVLK